MGNYGPGSLLHPVYGVAAADIRAAVGASQSARLAKLHRQLDGVRRSIVLYDRDYRGHVIRQSGTGAGQRITPNHQKFIGLDSPDDSILWSGDEHDVLAQVNTEFVCDECIDEDELRPLILNEATLDAICAYCSGGTPPPWPT